jgi:hypothetical protein
MLHLPVSLGEAIDKLTILDIKLDKITDNRRDDVKKEYDLLYDKLQEFIVKYETSEFTHMGYDGYFERHCDR